VAGDLPRVADAIRRLPWDDCKTISARRMATVIHEKLDGDLQYLNLGVSVSTKMRDIDL
jgi:hypothetical protein